MSSGNWQMRKARRALQSSERSEEHTSELQSQSNLVCRLLLEKKKHILLPLPSFNENSVIFALCSVSISSICVPVFRHALLQCRHFLTPNTPTRRCIVML